MARRGRPPHPDSLTPREWEVLALLRDGLTNEAIAARLGVTVHAARYHVSEILSKLGVSTREQAAAWRPEPEAPRWTLGRAILAAAGTAVVLAAVLGLALLAWGVSRGGSGEGDEGALLQVDEDTTVEDVYRGLSEYLSSRPDVLHAVVEGFSEAGIRL